MAKKQLFTTEEAMTALHMSRGTFFSRVKDHQLKPANFNPNLKRQHNPVWRREDIAKLGTLFDDEDEEEPDLVAA